MVRSVKSLSTVNAISHRESAFADQRTVRSDTVWKNEVSTSLRGQTTVDDDNTWTRVSRNLLLSFVLLFGVVLAGTLSVRDISSGKQQATRECPLNPWLGASVSGKCTSSKSDEPLEELPGDWDRVLTSFVYECVFDPVEISIKNLLTGPPPTFKSKADLATVGPYISLVNRMRSSKQYITLSE